MTRIATSRTAHLRQSIHEAGNTRSARDDRSNRADKSAQDARSDQLAERNGRPRLTAQGRELLQLRLEDLREQRLPELRSMLVDPERDERMVAEFTRVSGQVSELEALLASSEVLEVDPEAHDGRADLGMRVRVRLRGEDSWVRPVHPAEAFLDDERISAHSPLAIALMGARAGHTVWVDAPSGACPCEVLEVDPRA